MLRRTIKPKNQRVKRALKKREPKVFENAKSAIVVRGQKSSQMVNDLLTDIYMLKKPDSVHFRRKNAIHPFEDTSKLEGFARAHDCGLFAFGSHSKKRPHNLVLGRMHDHVVLDMIELGVSAYKGTHEFKGSKPAFGEKPCFVFHGNDWDTTEDRKRLKNLILDFFRGLEVTRLSMDGVQHVIACSMVDNKLYFRMYCTKFHRSASKVPRVELEPCGPSFDAEIRRTRLADADAYRVACMQPKQAKPAKKKNVEYNEMGDKMGRIHMHKQNLAKLQTRKMVGLKKRKGADQGGEAGADQGAEAKRSRKE